jgi:hypothetical protein
MGLPAADRLAARAVARVERRDPFWAAQLTVLAAILLGFALPAQLTIGDPWLVPAAEVALLLGLILTTPRPPTEHDQNRRVLRMGLVGAVSAANVVSLLSLGQLLLDGSNVSGRALLVGGVLLWLTAVLLFGIWFWELDRGGPVRRLVGEEQTPDFLFPPMANDDFAPANWEPQLSDYLYLSFTNAAAFSPAESVPLSRAAKVLMALQTLGSLMTMVITVSYAVGNLK